MLTKTRLITPVLLLIFGLQLHAQSPATERELESEKEYKSNFIKLNLTSLFFKSYSLQYERVLNKTVSVAAAFNSMPSTSIPFKNLILKEVGDEPDTKEVIEKLRLSNVSFTPEVRFYLGKKGYGRGFYLAPFYRYSNFTVNNLQFEYNSATTQQNTIDLSGNFKSHTGGLLLGAQWAVGKSMCIDWWILGPHYGKGSGLLSGVSSRPLTASEQQDLRQELEDLDIPLTEKTVTVNAGGASMQLDGPWAGVRAGISLGIRF